MRNVLIGYIEDNEEEIFYLQEISKDLPCRIVSIKDLSELECVDIILLDVNSQFGYAFDIIHDVKRINSKAPVILTSGALPTENMEHGLEYFEGLVETFIVKPITERKLKSFLYTGRRKDNKNVHVKKSNGS